MKRHVLAIAVAALAFPSISRAQRTTDTLRLSLSDAISIALREADEVRLVMAQADIADAQIGTARSTVFPQVRQKSM